MFLGFLDTVFTYSWRCGIFPPHLYPTTLLFAIVPCLDKVVPICFCNKHAHNTVEGTTLVDKSSH
jgi:hypothetical protein